MPQNKKQIIAERRSRIAELYLKGWAQYKIGDELGVTQQQVSKDLKVLTNKWRESALVDVNEIKLKELARIDNLEKEAWEAWEKSKKDTQETTKKAKGKGKTTTYKEQTVKDITMYGDPRFFQTIQWCINKRCEIFGVDAPKKIENEHKGENVIFMLPNNNRDDQTNEDDK